MARRYPDFILEVEKQLKEGGLSDTGLNLGITGSNFDMVIARNEGKDQLGIKGSDRGSAHLKELSLRNGVRSI